MTVFRHKPLGPPAESPVRGRGTYSTLVHDNLGYARSLSDAEPVRMEQTILKYLFFLGQRGFQFATVPFGGKARPVACTFQLPVPPLYGRDIGFPYPLKYSGEEKPRIIG